MTKQEFLSDIKNHMRAHKGEWLMRNFDVDGHSVYLKLYGKSISNLRIDGMEYGGLWDMGTQKAVLNYLDECITNA